MSNLFGLVGRLCLLSLSICVFLNGQANGRFADLKAQAFQAFDRGDFSGVAGKLEEVWEADPTDAKVAEYLAMGYLYGEKDPAKAEPLMQKAIDLGGQATFLAIHSHERLGLLQGGDVITQFCSGRLSVRPGKLVYVSETGEHNVTFTKAELRDFTVMSGAPGRIRIKAAGKTYVFRVKSETHKEAALLGRIAEQNLNSKSRT